MNSQNRRTYDAIYRDPVPSDNVWADIEDLFRACGAVITEGHGSRVRVKLNEERAVFHRPHPKKVTDKGAVKAVRKFLNNAGVKP